MMKHDLGRKMGVPAEPIQMKRDEKVFPTLWIEETEGSELELPDSGTMTISFVVRERTEREDAEGKKTCSYRLEVRSIDGVEPDETDEPEKTTEREFDRAVTTYSQRS